MRSWIAICLQGFLVPAIYADTIHVPGDYPTVLQALDVAVAGDVVELAPGEYTDFETRSGWTSVGFLKAGVTLQSAGGAFVTMLRLPSAPVGSIPATLAFNASGGGVVIRGLTLTGDVVGMCGLRADHNDATPTSVTMEDCFVVNLNGEGLRVVDYGVEGGSLTIRRCFFSHIDGVGIGYASVEAILIEDSQFWDCPTGFAAPARFFTAQRCSFLRLGWAAFVTDYPAENAVVEFCSFDATQPVYVVGGAGSRTRVTFSTFVRASLNVTTLGGLEIGNNTFYGGEATAPLLETLNDQAPRGSAHINHNVFAYAGADVAAVRMYSAFLFCNVFWSNPGGNVVGGSLTPTDQIADPLFCNRSANDLRVHLESVCLAPNNPNCGNVGSMRQGCGPVSVRPLTWGQAKALYH